MEAFDDSGELNSRIFSCLKPAYATLRLFGLMPVTQSGPVFHVTAKWIIYSFMLLCSLAGERFCLKFYYVWSTLYKLQAFWDI